MAKAIINKHVDNVGQINQDTFSSNKKYSKGEIVICNDSTNPSLWIKDNKGDIRLVGAISNSGESGGSNVEITQLRGEVTNLSTRINEQVGKPTTINEETGDIIEESTGLFAEVDELKEYVGKPGTINEETGDIIEESTGLFAEVDELKNMQIDIDLGDDSEDKRNYLEIEDENKLSVRSINSNSTILQNDILVTGLGNSKIGSYSDGMTITAGTSVYEILRNIFQKEVYPQITAKTADISVSVQHKNFTLKNNELEIKNNGIIEVGERIILDNTYVCGSTYTSTDSYITGMTYGYSYENNNKVYSTDDYIKAICNVVKQENIPYGINLTKTGFTFDNNFEYTTPTVNTVTDGAYINNGVELGSVIEGNNTVKMHVSGATYYYSADNINQIYYCSNMGNTNEEHKHTGITSVNMYKQATSELSKTVIGKYKYFLGCTTKMNAEDMESDDIRALSGKTGWVEIDEDTTIIGDSLYTSDGTSIVIACPSKYELKTVQNGQGDATQIETFDSEGTCNVLCGTVNVNYNVYMYPIESGVKVSLKNIVIGKKEIE